MNEKTPQAAPEDLRARAVALLEEALDLLDGLELSAAAARLDYVIAEVRGADLP